MFLWLFVGDLFLLLVSCFDQDGAGFVIFDGVCTWTKRHVSTVDEVVLKSAAKPARYYYYYYYHYYYVIVLPEEQQEDTKEENLM
jgi:hypothetical protein